MSSFCFKIWFNGGPSKMRKMPVQEDSRTTTDCNLICFGLRRVPSAAARRLDQFNEFLWQHVVPLSAPLRRFCLMHVPRSAVQDISPVDTMILWFYRYLQSFSFNILCTSTLIILRGQPWECRRLVTSHIFLEVVLPSGCRLVTFSEENTGSTRCAVWR